MFRLLSSAGAKHSITAQRGISATASRVIPLLYPFLPSLHPTKQGQGVCHQVTPDEPEVCLEKLLRLVVPERIGRRLPFLPVQKDADQSASRGQQSCHP